MSREIDLAKLKEDIAKLRQAIDDPKVMLSTDAEALEKLADLYTVVANIAEMLQEMKDVNSR